ncbi:hypothetical protein K7X08_023511 [Anisodus acutangulus]|uniref:Uncharacterized protein n=1 Tax=Anisodus acutangulus TaxID=402998 RepID=A0A9Q1L8M9_9SOLA|nr:hypothetical protein K7X08_023511 [Anisodus acutangulus]
MVITLNGFQGIRKIAPLRSIYKVAGSVPPVEFQSCSGLSETSFMSEQAIFYLGSIGLLGEYCPWSRKKNRHCSGRVDCMHLRSLQEEHFDFCGCWEAQPALCICFAEEFSEHS